MRSRKADVGRFRGNARRSSSSRAFLAGICLKSADASILPDISESFRREWVHRQLLAELEIVAAEASCTEMLAEQPSSAQFPGNPPRNARTLAHSCAFRSGPGIPAGSVPLQIVASQQLAASAPKCSPFPELLAVPGPSAHFRSEGPRNAHCPASLTHDSADPIIPGTEMSCEGSTGPGRPMESGRGYRRTLT